MNDKPQIKLSETVVLIDAAFLNFVITDMKGYFEETLQRSLQEIDLSMLTTYLTLDAGITEGKNEVQFLFVYDKDSSHLAHCHPSDLEKELNGVAFQSPYGEYSFASVPSEGMVQSPNQKIPDRKTKCVIKTHINIKQNVIFGAKLKPV